MFVKYKIVKSKDLARTLILITAKEIGIGNAVAVSSTRHLRFPTWQLGDKGIICCLTSTVKTNCGGGILQRSAKFIQPNHEGMEYVWSFFKFEVIFPSNCPLATKSNLQLFGVLLSTLDQIKDDISRSPEQTEEIIPLKIIYLDRSQKLYQDKNIIYWPLNVCF